MRAARLCLLIAGVSISTVLMCPLAIAQNDVPALRVRNQSATQNNLGVEVSGRSVPPLSQESRVGLRAFPHVALGDSALEYIGTLSGDGKLRKVSGVGRIVDTLITASVHGEEPPPPTGIQLHPFAGLGQSKQRIVEDFEPTAHAVKVAQVQSPFADLRDLIVRLAVGTERDLIAPSGVTTDSRHRVIVTDPTAHTVHVLDYEGKDSFRIVGGPGRRLRKPYGVAVDGEDNIYVCDYERGMVLVYNSGGRFLRYIGELEGEGLYEAPRGIAIDRKAGHIYLIDTLLHRLFILDLQGNVLRSTPLMAGFGNRNGSTKPGEFKYPVGIAVHNDEIFVLDANGIRLQVLDSRGNFRKQFFVSSQVNVPGGAAPGVCVDDDGNIYVTDTSRGTVRAYDHSGILLGAFGRPGHRVGEFNLPAGIWADSQGRIYVADLGNLRLQVFRRRDTRPRPR